jgi:hypothetical protein
MIFFSSAAHTTKKYNFLPEFRMTKKSDDLFPERFVPTKEDIIFFPGFLTPLTRLSIFHDSFDLPKES